MLKMILFSLIFSSSIFATDCKQLYLDLKSLNDQSYALSKTLYVIDEEQQEIHLSRLHEVSDLSNFADQSYDKQCEKNTRKALALFESLFLAAEKIHSGIDKYFIYHFAVQSVQDLIGKTDFLLVHKFHYSLLKNYGYQDYRREQVESFYKLVTLAKIHIDEASAESHGAFLLELENREAIFQSVHEALVKYLSKIASLNKALLSSIASAESKILAAKDSIAKWEGSIKLLKEDRLKLHVLLVATTAKKAFYQAQLKQAKSVREKNQLKKIIDSLSLDIASSSKKINAISLRISDLEKLIASSHQEIKEQYVLIDKYVQKIISSKL